ncbi:helix-turn-helix transcriptional regulator [Caulobacter sp. SL161]|uniref:helix-turn-helix transcriptional regulator n=1 Tax=Caulobacter sp. SL161 TaxID=2995156 RepID=UPI0022739A99|nr:helix-turn-helix transcriptional regulator [Caulobacter sp. SL161]MCY1648829.1 helix-turn-helix transcriptional regulator [Caulobacter sp. SL161]
MIGRRRALEHRITMIAVVVILQLAATLFFLVDVTGDLRADGSGVHIAAEAGAAVALLVGVLFGAAQVRWLVLRARQDEAAVAAAKGALADLARLRFSDWKLTAAEADVALFALKGCDVAEIAALRGAAAGTVRAQLARVYAKAGVNSQSALMALFLEELVEAGEG